MGHCLIWLQKQSRNRSLAGSQTTCFMIEHCRGRSDYLEVAVVMLCDNKQPHTGGVIPSGWYGRFMLINDGIY